MTTDVPTGPMLPQPGIRRSAEPSTGTTNGTTNGASIEALTATPVRLGTRGDRLSYREARQSPCASCIASPCCTHLLLNTVVFKTLLDVDHAAYLLNFEGIVLALASGRAGVTAQVYLHQPCGYLDVPSGLCTVHSTPVQPAICIQYNAHSCGYREAFATDVHPEHPLLDPRRMAWFAEQMIFDDDRQIIGFPAWEDLLEAFGSMPTEQRPYAGPAPDPMVEEWRTIVLSDKGDAGFARSQKRHSDPEVSNPCQGCGAWCCETLVFNRGLPGDSSQLEFLRYCLGFPGVEVGVADDNWSVIVRTKCRHLQDGLCSVYGMEERPLKCSYFDAMSCGYRGHFGVPRPDDFVRISRAQFPIVASSIMFDEVGRVMAIPPIDILRGRVEDAERAGAGARSHS